MLIQHIHDGERGRSKHARSWDGGEDGALAEGELVHDTVLRKSPMGQIRPRDVVESPWDREQEPFAQ